jgi:cytochrome b6-f complex iron-sulfur subunit
MGETPSAGHTVEPGQSQSRRAFLRWSVVAWGLCTASLVALAGMVVRFLSPRTSSDPGAKFSAGKPSDFPDEGTVYENFKQSHGVWLLRVAEDGRDKLVALAAVCTHLGCVPNWSAADAQFKCPCHGSGFRKDGVNFEGPAPRSLERYRVYLDSAGNIVVDKSRTFRKELGQWQDSESYVGMS